MGLCIVGVDTNRSSDVDCVTLFGALQIMALKFKYKSKDEVPAEHSALYVERDGAFVLDAEGAVDKARVDEFRTNNLALKKQLDDLAAKYEGIDPDAVKTVLAETVPA